MKNIKHYKVDEKLGVGGMGVVYKGFDTILHRDVAIKVMHNHLLDDPKHADRFLNEARAAARLTHPNIVTIYEISESEVGRYIAMEYVHGRPLMSMLKGESFPDTKKIVKIVSQILDGVHVAHEMGILHRDIKPDNILVTSDEIVKILDFGIAKITAKPGLTVAGDVLGTVEYMAQEQMLGEELDARCDIYSVGVVLYQLLTHRLPFTGDNPVAMLYKQLNENPVPPSHYNGAVSSQLDQVVLNSICSKEKRWKTAKEFSEALLDSIAVKQAEVHTEEDPFYDTDIQTVTESTHVDDYDRLNSVFVGRKKELTKLISLYNKAEKSHGQTAIVMGEAGIGKSTLAEQLRRYVKQNKGWVLYGASLYQEGMDAYMPYIDALREFFSSESYELPDKERQEIKTLVREKIPLLMEFAERFTTSFGNQNALEPTTDVSKRINLIEGIYLFVSLISTIRPVVLIIDDLQWADESSLRLFHYIARHMNNDRVLMIGISRTDRFDLQKDGKPGKLIDMLSRMRREGLFQEILLTRLNLKNCEELIDKALGRTVFSEDFYERLFRETNGNPFFALETLKLLRENGSIYLENGEWRQLQDGFSLDVPDRVEDVFMRQISGLGDEEHEVLQVASVIGYKFDISILAALVEMRKIKLLKMFQRIEKELTIITSTENGYQFEHPMLRELLYNEIPAALRKEYHLMTAEEFERIYDGDFGALVGEVAQHYRLAGEYSRAIPLLYKAGSRAFKISAYREASLLLEDLIKTVEQSEEPLPETIPQTDIYLKMGICYEEIGQWETGVQSYEKLLEFSEIENNHQGKVDALRRMGRIFDKQSRWNEALASYEECLAIAEEFSIENVKSRVYNNLGVLYMQKGDFDEALKYFEQTIDSVDNAMGLYDKAHALTNIGAISNMRSDYDAAQESYLNALEIYRKKGDQKFEARVYHNIAMTYSDQKEWTKSIEAFEKCLQLLDDAQDRHLLAITYVNMGKAYARQCDPTNAKKYNDKAYKAFKNMEDYLGLAESYYVYGLIYAAADKPAKAEKYFLKGIKMNEEKEFFEGLAESCMGYADFLQKTGNLKKSLEFYQKSQDSFSEMGLKIKVQEVAEIISSLTEKETTLATKNPNSLENTSKSDDKIVTVR